ncbi:hypothetical protein [Saccharothrix australiensis]|uniref:hypothetical protein n=1 Tax=Saccharothrix australiensis TaxID=2072 RepID=UPI0014772799|nr:hypothetical protein [Saccharothrix australiensis]
MAGAVPPVRRPSPPRSGPTARHPAFVAESGEAGVLGFSGLIAEPPELDLLFVAAAGR